MEINENVIHDMMSGDIPGYDRKVVGDDENPNNMDSVADKAAPDATVVSKPRKKREQKDYPGTFLQRRASEQKRHTYISAMLWDKLTGILPVIAPGITIPTFIDNVLTHHLETYKDEINEMYMNKTEPL